MIIRIFIFLLSCALLVYVFNNFYIADGERKFCGTEFFLENKGKMETKKIFEQISIDCKDVQDKYTMWKWAFIFNIIFVFAVLFEGIYKFSKRKL